MYYINKVALAIVNPVTFGVVLMVVGLVLVSSFKAQDSSRRRKWGVRLMAGAMVWFCMWSMAILQRPMCYLCGFGRYHKEMISGLPTADAIVNLGGGMGLATNGGSSPTLSPAAERPWCAVRLWKAGKAPFIISTGVGIDKTDACLIRDFGVPESAILIENKARNTEENAIYTERLLRTRVGGMDGKKHFRVLLVTSFSHMRRSMMIFKKRAPSMECIPVPVDFGSVTMIGRLWPSEFIPSIGSLSANMVVYKECLGVLGYKLRGF